jgi:hypothetical protein
MDWLPGGAQSQNAVANPPAIMGVDFTRVAYSEIVRQLPR